MKEILLVFGSASFQEAESLASMLPHPPLPVHPSLAPSLRCPLPRGPPLFSGLARAEQRQSGARREQTRVSLTASLHAERAQTATVQPLTSPVCLCLVYTDSIYSSGCATGAYWNNAPARPVLTLTQRVLMNVVLPCSPRKRCSGKNSTNLEYHPSFFPSCNSCMTGCKPEYSLVLSSQSYSW